MDFTPMILSSAYRELSVDYRNLAADYRNLAAAYRKAMDDNTDLIESNNEAVRLLNEIIAERDSLKKTLMTSQAEVAATEALVNTLKSALRTIAPNHQLLAESNYTFKSPEYSGRRKTNLFLMWQEVFDANLRECGITNPADYRID